MDTMKKACLLVVLALLSVGCMGKAEQAVLSPTPREVTSPSELPADLAHQQIYWQGELIYLDGSPVKRNADPVEFDPVAQLKTLGIYKFSHNGRYLAYLDVEWISNDPESFPGFPGLRHKISVWDLAHGEQKVLVDVEKVFSKGAMLGGIAFTPDDSKVLFAVLWRDEQEAQHVDLATVDIMSGSIERLGFDPLPVYSLDLDISPDGKWAVLAETSTLDERVCLLVNLEKKTLECLRLERGWYQSTRFTPDGRSIVYDHSPKIAGSALYRSQIDGMAHTLLVSGLSSMEILLIYEDQIIFRGATNDNYRCSNVYVVNLDGSDLRRLLFLGQECLTDKDLMR